MGKDLYDYLDQHIDLGNREVFRRKMESEESRRNLWNQAREMGFYHSSFEAFSAAAGHPVRKQTPEKTAGTHAPASAPQQTPDQTSEGEALFVQTINPYAPSDQAIRESWVRSRHKKTPRRLAGVVGSHTPASAPADATNVAPNRRPRLEGEEFVDGQFKPSYRLADGTLTTSIAEADRSERETRENRRLHAFEQRMIKAGRNPEDPYDRAIQEALESGDSRAAGSALFADADRKADAYNSRMAEISARLDAVNAASQSEINKAIQHAVAVESSRLAAEAQERTRIAREHGAGALQGQGLRKEPYDPEKMIGDAWAGLSSAARTKLVKEYQAIFKQNPDLIPDGQTPFDAAISAIRQTLFSNLVAREAERRAPKSNAEFVAHKILNDNILSLPYQLAGQSKSQRRAEFSAMNAYESEHPYWGITGSVIGMAVDPITWISGGVGKGASKIATGAVMRPIAATTRGNATRIVERALLSGALKGWRPAVVRGAGAVAGGSANFGTFEFLKDIQQQVFLGGTVDEYGNVIDGFDIGSSFDRARHGLAMGGATGVLGQAAGSLSKSAGRIVNTVARGAAKLGTWSAGVAAEAGLFTLPELIEGKDDLAGAYRRNLAMVLGFKVQGALQQGASTVRKIREAHQRTGISLPDAVRLVRNENRIGSEFLTEHDRETLRRAGCGDLTDILFPEHGKTSRGQSRPSDGSKWWEKAREVSVAHAQQGEGSTSKLKDVTDGYELLQRALENKSVPQELKAKLIHIVTGGHVGTSPIHNVRTARRGGEIIVEALDRNGEVISSRSFKSERAAKAAKASLEQDVENGEHFTLVTEGANARIVRQTELALHEYARQNGISYDEAVRLYNDAARTVKDHDLDATAPEQTPTDPVEQAKALLRTISGMADAYHDNTRHMSPEAVAASMSAKYSVDMIKIINKPRASRNAEEKRLFSEYLDTLRRVARSKTRPRETADGASLGDYSSAVPSDRSRGAMWLFRLGLDPDRLGNFPERIGERLRNFCSTLTGSESARELKKTRKIYDKTRRRLADAIAVHADDLESSLGELLDKVDTLPASRREQILDFLRTKAEFEAVRDRYLADRQQRESALIRRIRERACHANPGIIVTVRLKDGRTLYKIAHAADYFIAIDENGRPEMIPHDRIESETHISVEDAIDAARARLDAEDADPLTSEQTPDDPETPSPTPEPQAPEAPTSESTPTPEVLSSDTSAARVTPEQTPNDPETPTPEPPAETPAFREGPVEIALEDGKTIKGHIYDREPDGTYRIATADGRILTLTESEAKTLIKSYKPKQTPDNPESTPLPETVSRDTSEARVTPEPPADTPVESASELSETPIQPIGTGIFGKIYDAFKGKVKEAARFLFAHKSGEAKGVFNREELGEIGLIWGDNKKGLAHIIRKHIVQYSDFNSVDEMLKVLEEVIAEGDIIIQKGGNYKIEKDGHRVIIAKNDKGNFVITAYDNTRTSEQKKRSTADESLFDQLVLNEMDGTLVPSGRASLEIKNRPVSARVTPEDNQGSRAVASGDSDREVNTPSADKQPQSQKSSDFHGIPLDEKGKPDYTGVPVEKTVAVMDSEDLGLRDAENTLKGAVKRRDAARRKFDGILVDMTDPARGKAARARAKAELDRSEKEVAYWQAVHDVYAARQADEKRKADEAEAARRAEEGVEPTEAQKAAGNYKMEHRRIDGYNISIENPKGSARRGKDADGKEWQTEMHHDYGYIRGTEGVDGDHIDVFLSDTPEEGDVYVIDQCNEDGSFDEHKVMYGFPSEEAAREAYLSNYESGWTGLGTITHVSKDEFKKWVRSSKRKTKPFADYKNIKTIEDEIGRSLTEEEATSIFSQMENIAEEAPDIAFTPENWKMLFGEDGKTSTPIGVVKMGENQYGKLALRGRTSYFGMIHPTLTEPHVIIEKNAPAKEAERNSKYLFVRTFKKPNGGRIVHFESITVMRDRMEVSISSHEATAKDIKKDMQNEKILHISEKLSLDSEKSLTEAPRNTEGPDLVPTSDNILKGTDSSDGLMHNASTSTPLATPDNLSSNSDGKDNTLLSGKQGNGAESSKNGELMDKAIGLRDSMNEALYWINDRYGTDYSGIDSLIRWAVTKGGIKALDRIADNYLSSSNAAKFKREVREYNSINKKISESSRGRLSIPTSPDSPLNTQRQIAVTRNNSMSPASIERTAASLGLKVRYYQGGSYENGYYHDGVLHINTSRVDNGSNGNMFVLGHEMTHHLKTRLENPVLWKNLVEAARRMLIDSYGRAGYEARLQRTEMAYAEMEAARRGISIEEARHHVDRRYIEEELTADAVGDMFANPRMAMRLFERLENPSAAAAVWRTIRDFFRRTTAALGLGSPYQTRHMQATVDALSKVYNEALGHLRSQKTPDREALFVKAPSFSAGDRNTATKKSLDTTRAADRDARYLKALRDGDMATARRLVEQAAAEAGYSPDSDYQGTSAFNGPAPSNAYARNKDERRADWETDDYEGDHTLGDWLDFMRAPDDQLDFLLNNPNGMRSASATARESISALRRAISEGNRRIKVYRSVPADIKENTLRDGDWVTPSRTYAKENADVHGWGENYRIIEQEVDFDDLWWDSNDINEWGYDSSSDMVYANTPNNRKLLETVTRDDAGEIIPLSRRFDRANSDPRFSFATGPDDFDRTRDLAVRHKGLVMPGLTDKDVKVVDVPLHDFKGPRPIAQAKSWANEHLVGMHWLTDNNGSRIEYLISNKTIGKYLSRSAIDKSANLGVHLATLRKLPEIISESLEVEIHPDYNKNAEGSRTTVAINPDVLVHRFYGLTKAEEQLYRVKTTIKEYRARTQPAVPHSFEVTEIELLSEDNSSIKVEPTDHPIYVGVPHRTAKLLKGVTKSYDPSVEVLKENTNYVKSDSEATLGASTDKTRTYDAAKRMLETSGIEVTEVSDAEARAAADLAGATYHIKTYHGTGADFDSFDFSHIGEGEGHQAFGWGGYVTEVKGIGKTYATAIGGKNIPAKIDKAKENIRQVRSWIRRFGDYDKFLKDANKHLRQLEKELRSAEKEGNESDIAFYADLIELQKESMQMVNHRELVAEKENQIKGYRDEIAALEAELKGSRHLYTVKIPDNTGHNYLDWDNRPTDEQKRMIETQCSKDGLTMDFFGEKISASDYFRKDPGAVGFQIYRSLTRSLGSDKAASEFLSRAGLTGIAYAANHNSGGREDSALNYVVFRDKDMKIAGHTRFMQDHRGRIYGWVKDGKIFLNRDAMNPETPLHEYTHLWDEMVRKENPGLWERGKTLMKKLPLWEEVTNDPAYAAIRGDENEIAGEVHSRLTGRDGARMLSSLIADAKKRGVMETARAVTLVDHLKRWLGDMFRSLKATLGKWSRKDLDALTPEDFTRLTLRDLAEGLNPAGTHARASDPRFSFATGPDDFDRTRDLAVRHKGLVMPGLTDKEVKVVDVPRHNLNGPGLLRDQIETWADKNPQFFETHSLIDSNGAEIPYKISKKTLLKYKHNTSVNSSDSPNAHFSVLQSLPKVLDNSIEVEIHPDFTKAKGINGELSRSSANTVNPTSLIHRFFGAVEYEGSLYRVKTTIKEFRDKNTRAKPHTFEVTKIELLESPSTMHKNTAETLAPLEQSENGNAMLTSIPVAKLLKGVTKSYDPSVEVLKEDTNYVKSDSAADRKSSIMTGLDVDEMLSRGAVDLANDHRDDMELRRNAYKAIGGNLSKLRKAMAIQRDFDRASVKRVADLAEAMIDAGLLRGTTDYDVRRVLKSLRDANGKEDISKETDRLFDIMVRSFQRQSEADFNKLLKQKGSRLDTLGIDVRTNLEVTGQAMMSKLREAIHLPEIAYDLNGDLMPDTIRMHLDKAIEELREARKTGMGLEEATGRVLALQYAQRYARSVDECRHNIAELKNDLAQLKETRKQENGMSAKQYRDAVRAIRDRIREERLRSAKEIAGLSQDVATTMTQSATWADVLRLAEIERIDAIHHDANADLKGIEPRNTRDPRYDSWAKRWNRRIKSSLPAKWLSQSLATFEQCLKLFGRNSMDGSGYLYRRFMPQVTEAYENCWKARVEDTRMLDRIVADAFGDEKMTWSRFGDRLGLARRNRLKFLNGKNGGEGAETLDVTFWDGAGMHAYKIGVGEAMYIYMADKSSDGHMKLCAMGIDTETVDKLTAILPPEVIAVADALQNTFFVETRKRYNEVHKRIFGTEMEANENYVPMVINKNALDGKGDFTTDSPDNGLSSTTTGSVIRRKVNARPLDILNANIFNVVNKHIEDMEHWAAFSQLSKDLNSLINYKTFANKVAHITSSLGTGDELMRTFRECCQLATGNFRQADSALDRLTLKVGKNVSVAKVSLRLYTAFKQLSSAPAFWTDASASDIIYCGLNPRGSWEWAMENLPMLNERWKGRSAGNEKIDHGPDAKSWLSRQMEAIAKAGMSPNAFVDALTCATGARAVYRTRLKRYRAMGYTEKDAARKALDDAEMSFNLSQQSSVGAYLSPMQMKRTVLSTALTLFRNSPMSYQRQSATALRNLSRHYRAGARDEMKRYRVKQLLREWGYDVEQQTGQYDGRTYEQSERLATSIADREWRLQPLKDLARLGIFGYVMPATWNLFTEAPGIVAALMAGDLDDAKDKFKDALVHALTGGWFEGLVAGNWFSDTIHSMISGDGAAADFVRHPLSQDLDRIKDKLDYDAVEALSDITGLLCQSYAGFNPAVLTDAVSAIIDATQGDMTTSKEIALCMARLAQVPQSQLNDIYFRELGCTGAEATKMTPAEISERYVRYKSLRTTLCLHDVASLAFPRMTEKREQRFARQSDKALKEQRLRLWSDDLNEKFDLYSERAEEYRKVDKEIRDNKNLLQTARLRRDLYRQPQWWQTTTFKAGETWLNHLWETYMTAKTPEEAAQAVDRLRTAKPEIVEAVKQSTNQSRAARWTTKWKTDQKRRENRRKRTLPKTDVQRTDDLRNRIADLAAQPFDYPPTNPPNKPPTPKNPGYP